MRNEAHFLVWEGAGGEGLRQRTSDDLSIVSGKVDQLRQASAVARDGAGCIGAAHRRVIYAIEDARDGGFQVIENLSVTDTRISPTAAERAYRQTEATAFASEIRQRATQLVDIEKQVAGRITAAAAGIATTDFPTTDHQFAPRIQSPSGRMSCTRRTAFLTTCRFLVKTTHGRIIRTFNRLVAVDCSPLSRSSALGGVQSPGGYWRPCCSRRTASAHR